MHQSPLLHASNTILWLKVLLTAAALVLLYVRYRRGKASRAGSETYSLQTRVVLVLAVLFSFAVFHNLGSFRDGSFVHYGEMFHYYLGPKYFPELGYDDLYIAVIVADTEQGNALAGLPFYTDLRTYQNAPRETALREADRIRSQFSEARWSAFKEDVAFFKQATGMPRSPGLVFLLMDHGYNGSPVSTFILGLLTNAVPVTQLRLLAFLDVILVVAMGVLVFRTFGFGMGALFSVYFCVNALNAHDYVSGSIVRYDWLFCIVAAVCLLERGRHASSAVFLTLSAMLRVFPAALFYGLAVIMVRDAKAARAIDRKHLRFAAASVTAALALFLLPAVSTGSLLRPWNDFVENTALHDAGVYVNHLGLRGIALFEPSHLSLEKFAAAFQSPHTNDIVRHWQDIKELEFRKKRLVIVLASLFVLACLTAVVWKRNEREAMLWPLLFVYAISFPSHYYYAFLCLLVLLFFSRPNSLHAFVPLCLLLVLNLGVLVTDAFEPSPIVFYTLVNLYLFVGLTSILGFELYANVLGKMPMQAATGAPEPPQEPRREAAGRSPKRKRPARARRK